MLIPLYRTSQRVTTDEAVSSASFDIHAFRIAFDVVVPESE
ncbi:MAG: hypothetical protein O3B86_09490 [Planctomycetota bacterium]|nr:hypothetical protein [Planctomycetota bacterium]